jgi:hypothetical protein
MLNTYIPEQGVYPYIIEACPHGFGEPLFPTHTHGLTEIGMPEFIMDPLAFGGEGNGVRINYAFDFFMNPQNNHLLQDILNGKVIKLPAAVLSPNLKGEPYTYCYREVQPQFEAVILAYGYGVAYEIPRMRFIQIWVEGDDFALTDEYYRGGVMS